MEEKSGKFQDWESQVKEYPIKKWKLKQEENVWTTKGLGENKSCF